jgi:hypothetical protein
MNKFKYIIYIALVTVAAASCRKTLELAPEDYYGDGNFWQNEAQVTNFIAGLHKQFRDNQFMFLRLGEMRGGGFSNEDRQNTSLSELTVINQAIEETSSGVTNWAGFYNPILQLNLFINRVEPVDFLAADRKSYLLGQAYAMRAYYYFHLLRTYGGVPLVLEPEAALGGNIDAVTLRKPRSSEAEVLAAIKSDINKSITLFGTAGAPANKSQWNPQAALMLKGEVWLWSAKVYNTTADLSEAKSALNSITGTSLLPNFSDVFKNKNNNEIILSIYYRDGEAEMGTSYSNFLYSTFNFDNLHVKDSTTLAPTLTDPLNVASSPAQIIQRYAYTFELFQSYDVADKRRNATFYDYYKTSASGAGVVVTVRNTALVKFLGEMNTANRRVFTDDWPVYREADRLLMLAEITNAEGGDPSSYIQQIRDRAFANADPTPFVNGSQDANELAIFAERSKEFVYEGTRWYDIRRMKYGGEPLVFISANHPYGVLDKGTQDYKILWPIEAAIWTNDPLVDQTPGYASSKPK